MGQKVHPLGFRVGITKKHQSQWFARFQKYGYSQSVLEDHMLRKTLLNMFSNFDPDTIDSLSFGKSEKNKLTPKAGKKSRDNETKKPKITQIKIERGLIPYEIGIQIHSDDCLTSTKAIDTIKLSSDLVSKLQKTRKFLFKAGTQLENTQNSDLNSQNQTGLLAQTNSVEIEATDFSNTKNKKQFVSTILKKRKITPIQLAKMKNAPAAAQQQEKKVFKYRRKKKRLSKSVFMRLKMIKKRFQKRQTIKKHFFNIISKGLLLRKKGNLIIRKMKTSLKNKNKKFLKSFNRKNIKMTETKKLQKKTSLTSTSEPLSQKKSLTKLSIPKNNVFARFRNRMYKKFANLFLTKLNKQFLIYLKGIMKYWHNQKTAPLGYNKKWYAAKPYALLTTLKNSAKNSKGLTSYQLEKLTKLIVILEKKSLIKMESLRKDFIIFGTIAKTRAFGYYQIITFLKQLKGLVTKIKKQNLTNMQSNALRSSAMVKTNTKHSDNLDKNKIQSTQKVVNKFINLATNNQAMNNELRKIKWITYLKNVVNKHRSENLFYYLATISDARKDLKALKHYIKKHSNFLFGIEQSPMQGEDFFENTKEPGAAAQQQETRPKNNLLQRVRKTLTQISKNHFTNRQKADAEPRTAGLQKAFLTQISTQRKMYKSNILLTPKISIKFFSVKTSDVLEKASIVAESIVDALEKRKAFRGVIKKAKEDLMRSPRVKGVKIQVAGRLNGAEIARSEWVRAGRVPLQTLRANIDYSYRTANTIYGIIGVKVWIFKGYTNLN
uniref:Small ribosomal subunit protein uS3c n=1 Tax=Pandorina morum TaxID=33099 RepID=A0A6C0RVT6_PANMO|nr:ribosomal protein S3 [Pandorina morum]